MAVRLPDTAEPMGNFAVAYAKDIEFADGERLQVKLDNGTLGGGGASYIELSQAEYDALTEDEKMNGKEYRTYDTGHIYKLGVEYGKDADISRSEVLKTYVSLYNLNTKKGLSLAWENNVDNTQKIIDALEGREEFIDSFSSSTNRIGIVGNYGTTINNFHIIKRSADLAIITATTNAGTILNRTYTNGTLSDWCVNIAVYTSLTELGLTADATVEDVVNTLKNGESFLAPVNTFTNYETIFPNKLPNDQWNKIHIIKGTSLANSHIRCFSQNGTSEYLANINNTNVVSWNDVSGTYIDISDSTIEKLGNEILKYPVGRYRINSTATGNKFIDLPSDAEIKCGLIEVNGTAVGKSPFTDTWVYRMYKFECLTGSLVYTRRLNSGATVGQIESDTGWCVKQNIYTSLKELGLDTTATINDIIGKMANGSQFTYKTDVFDYATEYNNIQYGTVTIHKQSVSRVQVFMTDKDTGNLYVGRMDNSNKIVKWSKMITNMSDPYACTSYTVLTGTEDLFTLPCGHYASDKVNTTYNYPITDSTNVLAHIYVLGHLNDPVNNKGYRIIFYYDNKGRAYRINEWWGVFSNGWQEIATKSIYEEPIILRYNMAETFSYPKYGITHNNTITEVVRAIGNYYASKYDNQNITVQVILSTNYNSNTFNMSLPCNGRSSITTITYMPYKFASRVKIETMNTHTGETYLGSLNDSETDDIVWKQIASKDYVDNAVSNSGNTFNGKEVKSITIDLSASAFQVKGTSLYKIALDNYISANTNVIKVEGYYVPPTDANSTYKDKRYIVHTSDSDRAGGIRYYDGSWTTCVCQSESGSKKGSGYAKIYYIN